MLNPDISHRLIVCTNVLLKSKRHVREQEKTNADLLDCGGQFQAQLNDLVLGTGEVTDPSQWGSVIVKKQDETLYQAACMHTCTCTHTYLICITALKRTLILKQNSRALVLLTVNSQLPCHIISDVTI